MQLLGQTLVSRNRYECFFRRTTNYVWKDIFFPKQKRFSGTSHFRANFMLVKSFLAKAYLRPFFGYMLKMYTVYPKKRTLYRCFPASQKEYTYTILFSKSLSPQKTTLQGTNISPKNGILKMIFLFPRWDMLIPWRVGFCFPKCHPLD